MTHSVQIIYRMVTECDDYPTQPDENDDGFWPSRDQDSPGYCSPDHFDEAQAFAVQRMADWRAGKWHYMGVIAEATIRITAIGTPSKYYREFTVRSAGIWGIESDADSEYLQSLYDDQRDELESELRALAKHLTGAT